MQNNIEFPSFIGDILMWWGTVEQTKAPSALYAAWTLKVEYLYGIQWPGLSMTNI